MESNQHLSICNAPHDHSASAPKIRNFSSSSFLNKLGYQVCASSGRAEHSEYLKSLGAQRIIDRSELSEKGRLSLIHI